MTTADFQPLLNKTESTYSSGVLKVLAYFDMFQYPLTREELHSYFDQSVSAETLEICLQGMVDEHKIFYYHGYYLLSNNALLVYRRIAGNKRAARLMPTAIRIGRFLLQMPFVRGIGISGSLSKNYADERSDIDFFVITKSNRLWIARTLMHIVKKLSFLAGRQHWFCMNYYIDEDALTIPDRNIYTATEVKTLRPIGGHQTFRNFSVANSWTEYFLPNYIESPNELSDKKENWLKRFSEFCLSGKTGNYIDDLLFKFTHLRWQRKVKKGKKNIKGLPVGLITDKHFARSNPGQFQEKLLLAYSEKLNQLV